MSVIFLFETGQQGLVPMKKLLFHNILLFFNGERKTNLN